MSQMNIVSVCNRTEEVVLDTLPVEGGTLRVENWHGTTLEGVALYQFGQRGFDRNRALLVLGMAKEAVEHLGWAASDFCNGHFLACQILPVMTTEELAAAERIGYVVEQVLKESTEFELVKAYFPRVEEYVACPWTEAGHKMSCGRVYGPCDNGEFPCCYCHGPVAE